MIWSLEEKGQNPFFSARKGKGVIRKIEKKNHVVEKVKMGMA